jgi:hypothetical protein
VEFISGLDTPEIYLSIIMFTTLILISCVQAKNSLMQRKGLFLGKEIKKNVPADAPIGAAPRQVKKNIKNLIHSINNFWDQSRRKG